jgi:hypothetical protein
MKLRLKMERVLINYACVLHECTVSGDGEFVFLLIIPVPGALVDDVLK